VTTSPHDVRIEQVAATLVATLLALAASFGVLLGMAVVYAAPMASFFALCAGGHPSVGRGPRRAVLTI
jgi:hypothetical protein